MKIIYLLVKLINICHHLHKIFVSSKALEGLSNKYFMKTEEIGIL